MQKRTLVIIALVSVLLILLIFSYNNIFNKLTGRIANEEHTIGPSVADQACMSSCMKCVSPGVGCTGDSEQCTQQCNVKKPEAKEETSCMEKCVLVGCNEFDFACQGKNQEKCEKECNMIKAPDTSNMSAEQLCITNCVAETNPNIRCGASREGETGGDVCQKCAASCVHLYAGPCLNDEKLKTKQKECQTCEQCYGEPVMGDSGEGWECIVSVKCKDASTEFGDEPGTGPGIGQEGFVAKIGDAVGNTFESIGNFFKNIFS